MMNQRKRQDEPTACGQLRANFLRKFSGKYMMDNTFQGEEQRRQELLKEIREGKIKK